METNLKLIETHCYCNIPEVVPHMLPCQECKKRFHLDCLKSGRPSSLMCDTFFNFICESCSSTQTESVERLKLSWMKVVILSIFNLQLEGGGKCGFFHWRDHICSFVDRNWTIFFGSKKKTTTWQGTVAGTLSSGCPQFFKSGLGDLGESGWWALTAIVPENNIDEVLPKRQKGPRNKRNNILPVVFDEPVTPGLRIRSKKNAIQAAIELKEKRSAIMDSKGRRPKVIVKEEPDEYPSSSKLSDHWSPILFSANGKNTTGPEKYRIIGKEDEKFITNIKSEPPDAIFSDCSNASLEGTPKDRGLNNFKDPIAHCSNDLIYTMDYQDFGNEEEVAVHDTTIADFNMDVEPDFTSLLSTLTPERVGNSESEIILPTSNLSQSYFDESKEKSESANVNKRKAKSEAGEKNASNRFKLMTEYDEKQLLQRLEKLSNVLEESKGASRLYRKLVVRQRNREMKKRVFDLDTQYHALTHLDKPSEDDAYREKRINRENILDRFQVICPSAQGRAHTSFVTRLLGFEDDQLESIISPYTMRTLKPFIFRDYESVPLRVKLLQEIIAYPHQKKGDSYTLPKWPIDYCYVKPHHIPVVNSLCREFFWPGIDLSECLQYPDFSCVVLYRKVIVGFAFMVPDVKYNEAYISFVFTHPEWRNGGIATFMIYHLIQTCMGKDVTLHVSITNPACFLYQKFGFKVEEVFLDFYNKYLPLNSKECRHALFLRLSR